MERSLRFQVIIIVVVTAAVRLQFAQGVTCSEAGYTEGCCTGFDCGMQLPSGGLCFCDLTCHSNGDCCDGIFEIGCYDRVALSFLELTSNYTVDENDTAILTCVAQSTPPPAITWLRSNTLLNSEYDPRIIISASSFVIVTADDGNPAYRISQMLTLANTQRDDDGMYTCRATNNESSIDQDFYLVVQVDPIVTALVDDQRFIANLSDNVSLPFYVDSNPPLREDNLSWFYSPQFSESLDAGDIVNITSAATNAFGSMLLFSDFVNKTVTLAIVNTVSGPRDSDPTNQGRYFLQAVQPQGSGSSYIDLFVIVNPEPPVSLSVLSVSARWILLEWELVEQSSNTHVVLQYSPLTSTNETLTTVINVPQTVYNVTEMISPFSHYTFFIRVCNNFTCSQFSDGPSTEVTTSEDLPSEPRDCFAVPNNSTSIQLSWNPSLISNGIILYYTITYLPLITTPTEGQIHTSCMTTGRVTHNIPGSLEISAEYNTATVSGLLKDTEYNFTITASTSAGEGLSSTNLCTAATTQDAPDSPPSNLTARLITPTLLEVIWQPPTRECQNGVITGYMILYTSDAQQPLSQWTALNTTDTTLELSLPVKAPLYIRATAATEVGFGPSATLINLFNNLMTTRALFEIRLKPISDCTTWTQIRGEEKTSDIKNEITIILQSICSCNVTITNIITSVFSCRNSPESVVFKAEMLYTDYVEGFTADDLINLLSEWVGGVGGRSLLVDGSVLLVDPMCPTELESLQADDCVVHSTGTVGTTTTTVIVAGAVAGGGILMLMLAIAISTACIVKRCRHQRVNLNIINNGHGMVKREWPCGREVAMAGAEEETAIYETIPDDTIAQRKISKVSVAENVAYVRANYYVKPENMPTTPTEKYRIPKKAAPLLKSGSDLSLNAAYGSSMLLSNPNTTPPPSPSERPPLPLPDEEGIYFN